jgi:transcriptional regulator with GAF, ATPase, and Fis domain
MRGIPSRTGLAALTEAANAVVPAVVLGLSRSLADGRVSVLYSYPHGIGEFVLAGSEVPEALLPTAEGPRQADAAAIKANPLGAVEWLLLFGGVQRVVSLRVSESAPPTRFFIGLSDPSPLTFDQLTRLEPLAEASQRLSGAPQSPEEAGERLRRLDLAAGLLPALLRVLDVRDVFDRLSATAKEALPHDVLLLILFNEDLTKLTVYAKSDRGAGVGAERPSAYPPAAIRAWEFDIINDHTVHPIELATAPAAPGARSSLRFPIRFDGRVIGGVGFLSFEPGKYTSTDVPVGRRLADLVALALSHRRLAEDLANQARRNEELRALTTNLELLDELLAALIDSGELPDVFGRISAMARKVLTHDAAALMVRLPDGRHARVYASSGFPGELPEITEVPPELLENPDWEYDIFDDLSLQGPRYGRGPLMGLRSLLRVPIRIDGRFAGALVFFSSALAAFRHNDILVARRMADRLAVTVAREREVAASRRADEATERAAKLEARVRALTDQLDARTGYRRVVGESAQWRQVLTQATQVASTDTTVLLLGESGTGKEVVARFLHRASPRSGGPFVALNCAALPEPLLEAELFGYERGAYTGATQSKPGQLEQAAGGTLFLDEVAEMSLSAQAKFLRVLQEREFQRLGGTRVLRTDARVVAATNRDLQRAIAQGQFREDLYYRLNVFAIGLPPLRDRRDDVLPLSESFLGEICQGLGRPPAGISRDARQLLMAYRWPGNVRELRNILERAAILCEGGLITAELLSLDAPSPSAAPVFTAPALVTAVASSTSAGNLQAMERGMIEQALQNARFNKSRAAKALGLTRHQLYIRMRKYGFE